MSVKGAAVCIKGFEDVTSEELKSFRATNLEEGKSIVSFEVEDMITLAKIAYKAKTTSRVFLALNELEIVDDLKKIEKRLEKSVEGIDFARFIKEGMTFKCECERSGEHTFNSAQFESVLGKLIIDNIEKGKGYRPKASMDNPDIIIFSSILDDHCIFGIDFCGFDTSKRDYHIFINKMAIKGTVAASLVYYAKVPNKKIILDTFSSSGTIPIEAALISEGSSPHNFRKEDFIFKRLPELKDTNFDKFFERCDKEKKSRDYRIIATDPILANTRSTTKNAKIAGVQKFIEASRVDIEWLDTKVDKKSVDFIITKLQSISKVFEEKDAKKVYKEFFYQAEYILKKKGRIIIMAADERLIVEAGKEYKFKEIDKRDIMIGKMPVKVVTLASE